VVTRHLLDLVPELIRLRLVEQVALAAPLLELLQALLPNFVRIHVFQLGSNLVLGLVLLLQVLVRIFLRLMQLTYNHLAMIVMSGRSQVASTSVTGIRLRNFVQIMDVHQLRPRVLASLEVRARPGSKSLADQVLLLVLSSACHFHSRRV